MTGFIYYFENLRGQNQAGICSKFSLFNDLNPLKVFWVEGLRTWAKPPDITHFFAAIKRSNNHRDMRRTTMYSESLSSRTIWTMRFFISIYGEYQHISKRSDTGNFSPITNALSMGK